MFFEMPGMDVSTDFDRVGKGNLSKVSLVSTVSGLRDERGYGNTRVWIVERKELIVCSVGF